MAESLVSELAARWPRNPEIDDDLSAACERLDWPQPEALVPAGEISGLAVAAVGTLVVLLAGATTLLPLALTVAAVPPLLARRAPVAVAHVAETRALGDAPALFGRLTLRLRVEPSLERAVQFAGDAGDGPLAESLQNHVRRSRASPEAGLQSFASAWSERAPWVERAAALVVDAADAPAAAREQGCERALAAARAGVEERAAAFAGEVRAPLTGLYAFGVLLPLAMVGVLPAARLAGVNVGIETLALLYNLLLPLVLLVASGWLLTQRPVSFPPPQVTRDHPAVPDRRRDAVLLGLLTGGITGAGCTALLPWAAPVAAVGTGTGAALVWLSTPAKELREQLREMESGVPDALALVGRRVTDGVAVERALLETAAELPGPTGDLLADAAGRGGRLPLSLHDAFFGRFGVLRDVPSPRVREAGRLFALAATEGPPAGDALVAAGDHLRELRSVEREARRELASITSTLGNTAVLFGPVVGGVTVAMVGRLPADAGGSLRGGAASTAAGTLSTASLGPVVGIYVLLLAAILTGLATALEQGVDRSLLGYRIGLALPTAAGAYVAAVIVAETVL